MTADEPASSQPGPPQGTVTGDRLECVLGAGWSKAAARRQHRGDGQLIPSDQASEHATGQQQQGHGGSPGEHRCAPAEQLISEGVECRVVGPRSGLYDHVPRWLSRLDLESPDFTQPAPETIAGHRGRLVLGDYQSHPWLARLVVNPEYVHVLEAAAPALSETAANVRRAREPMCSRQARRWRQEPPCFDGSETVSSFRTFFRRRDRTARPQRVAMRARKPCLLIRRLLRGRYDGFMRAFLQSEPGKLVRE
jgi:hypothetical protein